MGPSHITPAGVPERSLRASQTQTIHFDSHKLSYQSKKSEHDETEPEKI